MKVAVMTGFFTEWNMYIDPRQLLAIKFVC